MKAKAFLCSFILTRIFTSYFWSYINIILWLGNKDDYSSKLQFFSRAVLPYCIRLAKKKSSSLNSFKVGPSIILIVLLIADTCIITNIHKNIII